MSDGAPDRGCLWVAVWVGVSLAVVVADAEDVGTFGLDEADHGLVYVAKACESGVSCVGVETGEDLLEHVAPEDLERRRAGPGPPSERRTRTTRRSSGTRTRSTRPRSAIRSMSPVALDSETSRRSAIRLIDVSPWRDSRPMTWKWVMLTPALTSRSRARAAKFAHRDMEFVHDAFDEFAAVDGGPRRDRPRRLRPATAIRALVMVRIT